MNQNISFSPLDIHFARFMTKLAGGDKPELFLAAALLSRHVAEGHVCLDLNTFADQHFISGENERGIFSVPELSLWQKELKESPVVGKSGDYRPLILDDQSRLYLYRYWEYEKVLADKIRDLAHASVDHNNPKRLQEIIERLFPAQSANPDWQKIAALVSCFKQFTVISGSPGTGKQPPLPKSWPC